MTFGYDDSGFNNVTLDDSGPYDIHLYQTYQVGPGIPTGTYQPDGRDVDPFQVWDTTARTSFLANLNNLPANGTWTLTFADYSPWKPEQSGQLEPKHRSGP